MLIKNKKSLLFTILIIIILFLLSLVTTKQQLNIIKEDSVEKMMSLDLGFSSLRQLVDYGNWHHEDYLTVGEKLTALIYSVPKIVKYKFFNDKVFERIDIRIDFSDYLNLMKDRDRAIKDTILSNPTKVNAIIKHKGEKYKAKLRLKGDMGGHWTSKYRLSFRVNIKNNRSILGFGSFSIHKPRERQYPYDYTFQSMVREAGNLASVTTFAHVFVNGEDWGIMNIEEHVSKKFIEKQNRKSSVIVRFSNEKHWLYGHTSENPYSHYRISDPSLFLHLYNSKKSLKNFHHRKIYSYISDNILPGGKNIHDIDSFSRAYIMSLAWNNMHTLEDWNARYYFNPYTLKLEPITTDQEFWIESLKSTESGSKYANILANQSFLDKLPKNLNKVNKVISNIDKHLSLSQSFFPVDKKKNTKIVKENMEKIFSKTEKYLISPIMAHSEKGKLSDRNIIVKLPTKQQASEFKEHLHVKHYTDGTLELYNLLPDNVIVKNILFNGKSLIKREIIVPSYFLSPEPITISTSNLGIHDNMFVVNTEYKGFSRVVKNNITLVSDKINNPLLLNTANDFDFINKLDEKKYEIIKGNWNVNKPIIVEGDLHISLGTSLVFSKNAYIIVKGSLIAIGGEDNPITLKAISDSWKGIYVLNADKKSHFKNVNISNLSALEDELLKLTGGITFYKSDVDFENVKINDIKAEDALNIVESKFTLNSVYINNTASDGLDSDFSKGSVLNSEFSDIGGDALDFSGSNVSIVATEANNIKDKAISAGEKSTLIVKNSTFNNIGVGVASKDGSSVAVTDTKILDYKLYGAMTYLKKDFYDMPSLTINNTVVSDGRAYIRQKGTSMTVDGIDIPETKISVKKLYKTKVMEK